MNAVTPEPHSSSVLHDPNDPWAPKHLGLLRIIKRSVVVGVSGIVLSCTGLLLYAATGEWRFQAIEREYDALLKPLVARGADTAEIGNVIVDTTGASLDTKRHAELWGYDPRSVWTGACSGQISFVVRFDNRQRAKDYQLHRAQGCL